MGISPIIFSMDSNKRWLNLADAKVAIWPKGEGVVVADFLVCYPAGNLAYKRRVNVGSSCFWHWPVELI